MEIIYNIILSISLIFLIHYLFDFFKSNLSTPKIKDFVKKPDLEYKKIYDILKDKNNVKEDSNTTTNISNIPQEQAFGENESKNMKNELKTFLANLENDNDIGEITKMNGETNLNDSQSGISNNFSFIN
jgi:hypothetical protein